MNHQKYFNIAKLIMCVAFLFMTGCDQADQQNTQQKPNLYERVVQSGKINCCYAIYPPYCLKDPKTGKMAGIYVDVLEKVGDRLKLEIVWSEEVGWGTIFEGLNSGRHDIFGAGLWRNSTRAKVGDFSEPVLFNGIHVFVRKDENRIQSLADINSPEISIAIQDGAMDDVIAHADFPKAKKVSIPQLNPWTDNLLNLINNKADIAFSEPAPVNEFIKKNPNTIKAIPVERPVRVFANCYAFKKGEVEFKSMIDATITELHLDGTIEKILSKYENKPGEFLRVADPYKMKSN